MAKNYKLTLTLACFILFLCQLHSQTTATVNKRTAVTRYKQDYEIKGISHPDNALLSKINISKYDYLRQANERVEAKDADNNIIIILYSEKEIARMKQEHVRQAPSLVKTVTDVQYVPTTKIEK